MIICPDVPKVTSKLYRQLCLSTKKLTTTHPSLPVKSWKQFWSFEISHKSRNVWFRLLHKKLPCLSILHSFIPIKFVTSICYICCTAVDDPSHFMFLCPPKLLVWQTLWSEYFDLNFSKQTLQDALLLLRLPSTKKSVTISSASIFGATILAIWRSHWSSVFDDCPFRSSLVIQAARKLVRLCLQEELLLTGISPLPLPHFSE